VSAALPSLDRAQIAGLAVAAYRVIGFAALTAILLGLVSYLGINVFFLFSTRWVLPAIVSPTDERVLALRAQVAQQTALRAKLVAERELGEAALRDARRLVEVQIACSARARAAVEADLADRRRDLARFDALLSLQRRSEADASAAAEALASMTRGQLEAERAARVIDREEYVRGQYQLTQMADARTAMTGRGVEIARERRKVEREIAALDALLAAPKSFGAGENAAALTPEVLRLAQELAHGELAREKAVDGLETAKATLGAIDIAIEQYDELLGSLENSAYLEALEQKLTVAFVPYENLSSIEEGEDLYGCHLGVLACKRIGGVVRVLEGEVVLDHPLRREAMRGRMVQLDVADAHWAQEKVLFAGRAPLLF
jgi:hypothetical protein